METKSEPTPLQWGDRIDHKKFGLGTVEGEPEGEKVHVIWDDPNRAPARVVSSFLRLVTRSDAKGGAFWNHEYSKLLKTVENTRAATNSELASAFRPIDGDGLSKLEQTLESEAKAFNDLRDFLVADEKGEHP